MARGIYREPRDRRKAGSRKHFSRLSSGTSYKSGTKEAQYLHSLPEKNKITRSARERRLQGLFTEGGLKIQSEPRAEKFDDLSTADHKVLNEGSESGHNHRYSIVVQDFDTQGIQSYPCKTQNFSGDGKEFTEIT